MSRATIAAILKALARKGSPRNVAGMARYGIVARKAYGAPMPAIMGIAKPHRGDHALALALWRTGWYDARVMTAFVDDPARVTPAQMDRWVKDFDNWAVCDGLCFHLFDKTPHAWRKAAAWTRRREEFVRRAGLALMAALAGHDKAAPDAAFRKLLPLIERASADDRNFVKKAASWALRRIGTRNRALHTAAGAVARRLAARPVGPERWVGLDAQRYLASAAVQRRLANRARGRRTR